MNHKTVIITIISVSLLSISCSKSDNYVDTDKGTKNYTTIAEEDYRIIAPSGLNIRKTPSLKGQIIKTLPYNAQVTLIGHKKNMIKVGNNKGYWAKIKIRSQVGWLFSAFIEKISYKKISIKQRKEKDRLTKLYQGKNGSMTFYLEKPHQEQFSNYFKMLKRIEKDQLIKHKKWVSRNKDVLTIKLQNGKTLDFKNYRPKENDDSIYLFYFKDYDKDLGYFIVTKALYEGNSIYLIDHKTGGKFSFDGLPAISPNKKLLLSFVSSDTHFYDSYSIWRIKKSGFEKIYTGKIHDTLYRPVWINNKTILIRWQVMDPSDMQTGENRTILIKKTGSKWDWY